MKSLVPDAWRLIAFTEVEAFDENLAQVCSAASLPEYEAVLGDVANAVAAAVDGATSDSDATLLHTPLAISSIILRNGPEGKLVPCGDRCTRKCTDAHSSRLESS